MKKLVSLIVCLALLLCCAGVAEANRMTVSVNGAPVAGFTAAHDVAEDGCDWRSFSAFCGEDEFSALLQMNGEGITVGVNGENYLLSGETVGELIKAAWNCAVSSVKSFDSDAAAESFTSLISELEAYAADIPALLLVSVTEANRAVTIAEEMGILNVNDLGDVTIAGSTTLLRAFASRFLSEMAEDGSSIRALASTKLWAETGMADAEAAIEAVKSLAAVLSAETEESPMNFVIRSRADGSSYAEINTVEDGERVSVVIEDRGGEGTIRVTKGGNTITVLVNAVEDENAGALSVTIYNNGVLVKDISAGFLGGDEAAIAYITDGTDTALITIASDENSFSLCVDRVDAEGAALENILSVEYGAAEPPAHEHAVGTTVTAEQILGVIR